MGEGEDTTELVCVRCGLAVVLNPERYEVFERMHYVCFHYEFEHQGDPDVGCFAWGCPSSDLGGPYSYGDMPLTAQGRKVYRERMGRRPPPSRGWVGRNKRLRKR